MAKKPKLLRDKNAAPGQGGAGHSRRGAPHRPDPGSIGNPSGVPAKRLHKPFEAGAGDVYEPMGSDTANSAGGPGLADRLLKKIRGR
jgi:hypothetical protein